MDEVLSEDVVEIKRTTDDGDGEQSLSGGGTGISDLRLSISDLGLDCCGFLAA